VDRATGAGAQSATLLVLEGWTVLRFSSADVLGRPEEVVAAVRRALRL
jgi:very-short-patch-repair endonuclease